MHWEGNWVSLLIVVRYNNAVHPASRWGEAIPTRDFLSVRIECQLLRRFRSDIISLPISPRMVKAWNEAADHTPVETSALFAPDTVCSAFSLQDFVGTMRPLQCRFHKSPDLLRVRRTRTCKLLQSRLQQESDRSIMRWP